MNAIGDLSHQAPALCLDSQRKGISTILSFSPRPCLLCYFSIFTSVLLLCYFSIFTMWEHPQLCYLQCLFQQTCRKCQKLCSTSTTTLIQINTYEFLPLFCRNYSGAQRHLSTPCVWVPLLVLPMHAKGHKPLYVSLSVSPPHTCPKTQPPVCGFLC